MFQIVGEQPHLLASDLSASINMIVEKLSEHSKTPVCMPPSCPLAISHILHRYRSWLWQSSRLTDGGIKGAGSAGMYPMSKPRVNKAPEEPLVHLSVALTFLQILTLG